MRLIIRLAGILRISNLGKRDSELEEECLRRVVEMKNRIKELESELENLRYESSFSSPEEV